jgi:CheY-like chemotaxis protein
MKRKFKVLIVDDEAIFAMSIQRLLTNSGNFVCELASTGEEAVKRVKKAKPDLVLMDVILTGQLNGIEAAAGIRSLYDTPIIFITGYQEKKLIERIENVEFSTYLIKPIKPEDLEHAIQRQLSNSKS